MGRPSSPRMMAMITVVCVASVCQHESYETSSDLDADILPLIMKVKCQEYSVNPNAYAYLRREIRVPFYSWLLSTDAFRHLHRSRWCECSNEVRVVSNNALIGGGAHSEVFVETINVDMGRLRSSGSRESPDWHT